MQLYELGLLFHATAGQQVKPDDHSELVPLLPIPNRTVKRLRADDSAGSRVKVGHRQAIYDETPGRQTGRFHLRCQMQALRAGLACARDRRKLIDSRSRQIGVDTKTKVVNNLASSLITDQRRETRWQSC